jgi:hypothetical protein
MSVVNSFTAGTTISSSAFNANFSDVATEITGSLPRDGQAGMTGQLKSASGTAAAPGMTFNSDTDSGFFLKSANTIGVAVGGAEVGTIGSTGFSSFPSGTAMIFAQSAAPTGWTKSTTHNDKALRVVSGIASSGGSTAFSTVFASRTIATANLPAHTHSVPTHTHAFSATSGTESADHTHTVSGTTASSGAHTHTVNQVMAGAGSSQLSTVGGTSGITTTIPSDGVHTHTFSATSSGRSAVHTHTVSGTTNASSASDTGSTGSGTALDFAVQYVDVIIATKD